MKVAFVIPYLAVLPLNFLNLQGFSLKTFIFKIMFIKMTNNLMNDKVNGFVFCSGGTDVKTFHRVGMLCTHLDLYE